MVSEEYKKLSIEDIIEWCEKHDELAWLQKEAAKTTVVERYTGRKQKLNADGTPALDKKGNPIWVADKSTPKKKEKQPITFVQLKYNFCYKFRKELLPTREKPKAPTMYELVAAAVAKAEAKKED